MEPRADSDGGAWLETLTWPVLCMAVEGRPFGGGVWWETRARQVINYDTPSHYEDYVHRVGRTGRAGNKGTAYTFVSEQQKELIPVGCRRVAGG